ncbi:DNA topoisomerase 1-like isoform X2 [Mangifera indica]|uniref:DNA topoisomerase 1-like isoform X2 n=1 Tax=Mangifera indica TaxID=29780 RepID=UPI001CF9FEF9|nr:DNA topoisomerase 1-like isoform X2 [Mangifera indica]
MRLAMSSLVSSTTSTRSAFLLRRFMATLQYRTLHSSFGFGNKYNKCCLLKCLNTWQSFHLFRSLPGACRFNSRYISSFLPLDRGIKLASLNSILFPRRYFFYVSKAANEEKRGNSFPFKFKKSWIQTKALASARKNQDVNMVTSASEQLVQDAKEGVTQKSKVNNKTKQPSRSKKSKEKLSAATASEQATVEKSPTLASKTSTGITTVETLDSSVSTKQQSNKKSENSSRKGKCSKVASQKQKLEKVIIKKHQGQKKLKPLYPPIGKSVVVVESVTKAKVFQGYLGDMYEVLPSYGHIRDLAARSGSVRPDDDFSMVWEVSLAAWTHLQSIRMALNGAESIILASDPDCEGEAIAWHITEMLQQQEALSENITVARVVFHEITEASIKSALQAPREVDVNLVHSYLARRALDYLIGFNISPLLWRKLPGCQSAGRVQSAALSLICDRELEIDEFKPQEYWTVEVELNKQEPNSSADTFCFPAHLTHFKSKKLNQYSISSHTKAKDIEQKINTIDLQVIGSKKSTMRKNPPTPYITSTLQEDAANILHFSASYTMKLAQKLYEGVQLSEGKAAGLITYMRTDRLRISDEAVRDIRSLLIERYGSDYASESPQKYFKMVKNAQEAHEAIRPTDMRRLPAMLTGILDEDSLKLYTLIWSRTMACQMEPAIIGQIQLDIGDTTESIVFRSSCSKVEFLGFQAVYEDANAGAIKYKENEEKDRDEAFEILNSLKSGEPLSLGQVELKQHHSQPPPRYSEGSLVKKLEELGIGRPSTYASTLKVLQDRKYVTVKSHVLYPEFRGRMVSAFLSHHFSEVTNYSFTADTETELDNVSAGVTEWKGLLKDYWTRFNSYCTRAQRVHIHQVEEMLGKTFGDFLFASIPNKDRACPSCGEGTLIFRVSRFGAGYFIGCNQHPKCKYIAKTLYGDEDEEEDAPEKSSSVEEPRLIGLHPGSHEKVLLKSGPYGFYVQLGEDRMDYAPKRVNASHIKDMDSITLEDALELLRFPLTLGNHPKDGHPVILRHGNTGFTVRHRGALVHVPKNMNPRDVTLEKALKFLSGKDVKLMGRRKLKVEEPVEAM